MDALRLQWTRKKPVVLGLLAGLLLGPLVSGAMGWQVSRAFLQQAVHSAVLQQQVGFCQTRARAAVKNPEQLDYSARYELAETWAKMPGQEAVDSDVVSGCSNGLSG
jgi:hypothetical protein